jgi:adenylylsulfate kinase
VKDIEKILVEKRALIFNQRAAVFWFTGLSGSGKTTITKGLENRLLDTKKVVFVLDGDELRSGINRDLGFTDKERAENIRRASEIALLFKNAGIIVLASFIAPLKSMRQNARDIVGSGYFYEIFVKASVEECMKRDVKGLYKKATADELRDFTGITSPYEAPDNPDLILDTEKESVDQSIDKAYNFMLERIKL